MGYDKPEELECIYRIDTINKESGAETHGWQVRVTRQRQLHSKFFSDSKHGSSRKALEKAKRLRDLWKERLPEPLNQGIESAKVRSPTGVPGLRIYDRLCPKSGDMFYYVQLNWTGKEGKQETATMSIQKYGIRAAFWKTVQRRARRQRWTVARAVEFYQKHLRTVLYSAANMKREGPKETA